MNNRLSSYDVEYKNKIYPGGNISSNNFYMDVYGQTLHSYSGCGRYVSVPNNKMSFLYSKIFWIGVFILVFGIMYVYKNKKKSNIKLGHSSRIHDSNELTTRSKKYFVKKV